MKKLRTVKKSPVRVGVVGCGVVAGYGHIPAILSIPDAELVALADPDSERLRAQSEAHDLRGYASVEEMLRHEELDAVAVCTQPDIRLDIIRIAAAYGLHAFCEKPLTGTVAEAEELVNLMDQSGLFVGMAFVYRGKAVVQRMMQLVRENAIGKLRAVQIDNLWEYHGLRQAQRRHRALQNLGALDCGVHDLDLARYVSGSDFRGISAIGDIVDAENSYPDHIFVQARMSNGVMVSIKESAVWGHTAAEKPWYQIAYHMVGENGMLSANITPVQAYSSEAKLRIVSGRSQWEEDVSCEKAWEPTYRQFCDTIMGKPIEHRFIADGHDALINMRLADEVIRQCGCRPALRVRRDGGEQFQATHASYAS